MQSRSTSSIAIGEIALVVIGILIALQINNWNETRRGDHRLATNLKTLTQNLESDILRLDEQIAEGTNYLDFWESLLTNSQNDSLAELYIENITSLFFPVNNAGYISLIEDGTLSLIKKNKLKSGLINYYGANLNNYQSWSDPLVNLAYILPIQAFEQSSLIKNKETFGQRMKVVLTDPSFVELTNSFVRLYRTVLNKLKERKLETQRLISEIEKDLQLQK